MTGETTITTAANNMLATEVLTSAFVNTAKLDCTVSSWVLGLTAPPPVGWKPAYCEDCFTSGNVVVKDMPKTQGIGECVAACIAMPNCSFVNIGYGDNHCELFNACKNPQPSPNPKPCDPAKFEGWTNWGGPK